MTNAIIVVGSARPGRVADSVAAHIEQEAQTFENLSTTIVDLAKLNLPFFDNERIPSDPEYKPTNESVIAWSQLVSSADAVILVTPEYNHTLSAIEKNAIDTLFVEWKNKPVVVIAYGWSGGSRSIGAIRELAPVVKMDLKQNPAELYFTKDIAVDGSIIDEDSVTQKIRHALNEIATIS